MGRACRGTPWEPRPARSTATTRPTPAGQLVSVVGLGVPRERVRAVAASMNALSPTGWTDFQGTVDPSPDWIARDPHRSTLAGARVAP